MPLSYNDVRYGYAYVLGRTPENSQIVEQYSKRFNDIETFRLHLMQSAEYQAKNRVEPPTKSFLAHTEPADIDTVMDEQILERVVAKTASYWTQIGSDAPHWSVLPVPKYAPDQLAENMAEFYNSGAGDLSLVRDLLRRMGQSPDDFQCLLEFGCGVGRATVPLASAFKQVVAVDISAPHIELAKQYAAESGAQNVDFLQATPSDLMPGHGYDLWYSRLVLHHNAPPVTLGILKKAFSGLPSKGIAIVHVRTHEDGYRFKISDYLKHEPIEMELHSTPQTTILELADQNGCRLVELHEEPGHTEDVTNIFVFRKR